MMDIPILLYHSIQETASPHFQRWVVTPYRFDEHMAYLLQHGYIPMPLSDIVESIHNPTRLLPARAVGITFDDGYEDFYTNAMPVLARYNIPVTIYIVAGYIGSTSRWLESEGEGDRRMMGWPQVNEIARAGIDVGAHTLRHPHLDTMEPADAYQEILGSKEILEQSMGQPVSSFAYPHGYHSKELVDMVKQAGFSSACAVKHGLSSTEDNPYALARIIVSRDTTTEDLGDLLLGKGLEPVTQEERLRTKVWRVVRKTMMHLRGENYSASFLEGRNPLYGNPTNRR